MGLTFAKAMAEATGVPIGLIPAAHGGTSMQQWEPSRKHMGGGSLYGATLARVAANGGKVAGILWYQGESDANPADAPLYESRMTELVQSFRADFGQPDLPFTCMSRSAASSLPADPDFVTLGTPSASPSARLAETLPNSRPGLGGQIAASTTSFTLTLPGLKVAGPAPRRSRTWHSPAPSLTLDLLRGRRAANPRVF